MKHKSLLANILSIAMAFVLVFASLLTIVACGDGNNDGPDVPATSVTLNKSTLSLEVGETEKLTVTVTPVHSTDPLSWSTSDAEKATVANDGTVTAVAEGTAVITATVGDVQATCTVTVTAKSTPDPDDPDDPDPQIEAVKAYDFTSSSFDASEWTAVNVGAGNVSVAVGEGLTIPYGLNDARKGYAVANPLKGKAADGFSVIINAALTNGMNDFESFFGFSMSADPVSNPWNFFYVAASGTGVRLNINGADQGTAAGTKYYDIAGGDVLRMETTSQYILTVSDAAITIYLNGTQVASHPWSNTWSGTAYDYDTLSFVDRADYFNLGIADNIWGNAAIQADGVSFYDKALTADEIAAINASFADFTQLNAILDELASFSASNYDQDKSGWDAAYKTFTDARSAAQALSVLTATQAEVDAAAEALTAAYEALEAFLRTADLTDGLLSAFPLDSTNGGKNIVTNSSAAADQVIFMNGSNAKGAVTATKQLSGADMFASYQGVSAAKLYEERYLSTYNNPNPYADRAATSNTMGLSIPTSAFAGATAESGLTITVNAYIENFYSGDWGRILQLGDYQFATTDGAQIFLAVNGNAAFDAVNNGSTSNVILNSTNVSNILARQWYSVSIVLDPASGTVTFYTSGYQRNDEGAIEDIFSWYIATTTSANVEKLIDSIVANDAENWLGRSFWDDADKSVVGAVSNLSVYSRALSATEVSLLHETSDLSSLITA